VIYDYGATYEATKYDAVQALKLIDPQKPFGTELFNAIAKVSISIGVEAVCLRVNENTKKIEVLLTQRSSSDSAYPGEWHCPRSVLRPGEEFSDVFRRLAKKESLDGLNPERFVENFNHPKEARGHFLSVIYLCTADGTAGTWFAVDTLPENTVDHHRDHVIPIAVKAFQRSLQIKKWIVEAQ